VDQEALDGLRDAIKTTHGCDSRWVETVKLDETFFRDEVHVFDLEGHPTATRCYAWWSAPNAAGERRANAVLHGATIDTPVKAVRASILARESTIVF
jgi:hypothetical protein